MSDSAGIWAVIPVKELRNAKHRLAAALTPDQRRGLALAMVEDVLDALAAVQELAGIAVVSIDPDVARIAVARGARLIATDATGGHTAAVAGAARLLAGEGRDGMLTMPGDVPLATSGEVVRLLQAHGTSPAFTICPAHDGRGSNAVLCSPPDILALSFGNDSFQPHLAAARARGIVPKVLGLTGIGLDIDNPEDLAAFMRVPSRTRTRRFLEQIGIGGSGESRWTAAS
ncbi:MAG: 2-phospho-L-lactate guanylyltransferase [Alphaproteobacteria bacterium]|nr:2-phospho-L-lactate guanylyltransferase [Alphaproteobacteria bacterium]